MRSNRFDPEFAPARSPMRPRTPDARYVERRTSRLDRGEACAR